MRRSIVLLLALWACGGDGEQAAPPDGGPSAATGPGGPALSTANRPGGPARRGDVPWEDPEPPGAQALAEAVVGAPWNADKTTRVTMSITTLVDRTTGLAGFGTRIAAREVPLAERLDRLRADVTDHEIVIRLSGSVLFDFDRAEIRADAERTLEEVGAVLAAHPGRPVRVEGHTDAIGSDGYNRTLSERRAAAVVAWFAAHGADPGRIRALGLGETRPVADNSTAAGRQLNRRVEIVVETGSP